MSGIFRIVCVCICRCQIKADEDNEIDQCFSRQQSKYTEQKCHLSAESYQVNARSFASLAYLTRALSSHSIPNAIDCICVGECTRISDPSNER